MLNIVYSHSEAVVPHKEPAHIARRELQIHDELRIAVAVEHVISAVVYSFHELLSPELFKVAALQPLFKNAGIHLERYAQQLQVSMVGGVLIVDTVPYSIVSFDIIIDVLKNKDFLSSSHVSFIIDYISFFWR